jgi:hypothetical protein
MNIINKVTLGVSLVTLLFIGIFMLSMDGVLGNIAADIAEIKTTDNQLAKERQLSSDTLVPFFHTNACTVYFRVPFAN